MCWISFCDEEYGRKNVVKTRRTIVVDTESIILPPQAGLVLTLERRQRTKAHFKEQESFCPKSKFADTLNDLPTHAGQSLVALSTATHAGKSLSPRSTEAQRRLLVSLSRKLSQADANSKKSRVTRTVQPQRRACVVRSKQRHQQKAGFALRSLSVACVTR